MAFRQLLLTALIPMSFAACGSSGDDTITPAGTHYKYVVDKALIPTTINQAHEYGLDLDGNGMVDNALGNVISTLSSMGFDVQGTVDKAVLEGSINLLVDVQTTDATFMSDPATGMAVYIGSNPTPAACDASTMEEVTCTTATASVPAVCTGCGHHLSPTGGSFTAAANTNDPLGGKIIGGTFNAGPGNLSIQIAIGGSDAINLNLIGARVKASSMSADSIGAVTGASVSGGIVFAGAVTQSDINTSIIPAIVTQLQPTIAAGCTALTSPPDCGCTGTAKTVISIFDTNHDCAVTTDEVLTNGIVTSLLGPDVTIDGQKALSVGIKVAAEKATF